MTRQGSRQGKKDEELNEIIDMVLNQVLGHEATEAFYGHLKNTHSIQKHTLAKQFTSFNSALIEYFGAGAAIIEQTIHKNLGINELSEEIDAGLLERSRILKLA